MSYAEVMFTAAGHWSAAVIRADGCFVDWPIRYPDGRIAYDFPERWSERTKAVDVPAALDFAEALNLQENLEPIKPGTWRKVPAQYRRAYGRSYSSRVSGDSSPLETGLASVGTSERPAREVGVSSNGTIAQMALNIPDQVLQPAGVS